jgi:hypothetical protein
MNGVVVSEFYRGELVSPVILPVAEAASQH